MYVCMCVVCIQCIPFAGHAVDVSSGLATLERAHSTILGLSACLLFLWRLLCVLSCLAAPCVCVCERIPVLATLALGQPFVSNNYRPIFHQCRHEAIVAVRLLRVLPIKHWLAFVCFVFGHFVEAWGLLARCRFSCDTDNRQHLGACVSYSPVRS